MLSDAVDCATLPAGETEITLGDMFPSLPIRSRRCNYITRLEVAFNDALRRRTGQMKPDSTAVYERARRLANQALWTIDLQRRRLSSDEPEDDKFVLRKWSDFHFLIVALTRLRRAAELAAKVPVMSERMREALEIFDSTVPHLKKMRDVAEHIDDYAVDRGRDRSISRKSLEVASSDGETWEWLGFEIDGGKALSASVSLFGALKDCAPLLKMANKSLQRSGASV
jgi:hypothetical protein